MSKSRRNSNSVRAMIALSRSVAAHKANEARGEKGRRLASLKAWKARGK